MKMASKQGLVGNQGAPGPGSGPIELIAGSGRLGSIGRAAALVGISLEKALRILQGVAP